MVSIYINPLHPELKEGLEALHAGEADALNRIEEVLAYYAWQLDFYDAVLFRDGDRELLGKTREALREVPKRFEAGQATEAAGAAFRLTKGMLRLDEFLHHNRQSRDPRLNMAIFLGEAFQKGRDCRTQLEAALLRVGEAWNEWVELRDYYYNRLPSEAQTALDKGFLSLQSALEGAVASLDGDFGRTLVDLKRGAFIMDELLAWREERRERADTVPVVGRALADDLVILQNSHLSDERVEMWLETLIPAFEQWWEAESDRILVPAQTFQQLCEGLEELLDWAPEGLSQPESQREFLQSWFDLFSRAKAESLDIETLGETMWGSLLLALLQDGVPDFLLHQTLSELEPDQPLRLALQEWLESGDSVVLLEQLEELEQNQPGVQSSLENLYV